MCQHSISPSQYFLRFSTSRILSKRFQLVIAHRVARSIAVSIWLLSRFHCFIVSNICRWDSCENTSCLPGRRSPLVAGYYRLVPVTVRGGSRQSGGVLLFKLAPRRGSCHLVAYLRVVFDMDFLLVMIAAHRRSIGGEGGGAPWSICERFLTLRGCCPHSRTVFYSHIIFFVHTTFTAVENFSTSRLPPLYRNPSRLNLHADRYVFALNRSAHRHQKSLYSSIIVLILIVTSTSLKKPFLEAVSYTNPCLLTGCLISI